MKKILNRLKSESFRNHAMANHPSHRELRIRSSKYGKAIIAAKRDHWTEYLEEMSANDIWTANKYLKSPVGDGGQPRIPTIKTRDEEGNTMEVNNNEDKAKVFAKAFFSPPPRLHEENVAPTAYPEPLPDPPPPDKRQIKKII